MLTEMAKPRRQRGGAMVEFTLAAVVLTPMLVLMPSLVKTADVNLASEQAARYGAWEQTVGGKSGDQLATEINNRFYTKPTLGLQTQQGKLSGDELQNRFWAGSGLSQRLFTAGEDAMGAEVIEGDLGGKAAVVESAVSKLGAAIGSVVPDSEWDLGGGKLFTVDVGMEIENEIFVSEEHRGRNCSGQEEEAKACVSNRAAILTDTWGARGPEQTAQRVRSLVPGGALQPLGDIVSTAGVLPLFDELKHLDGAFGKVEPDILPSDRYGQEPK